MLGSPESVQSFIDPSSHREVAWRALWIGITAVPRRLVVADMALSNNIQLVWRSEIPGKFP